MLEACQDLLRKANETAVKNVLLGKGGPFGAILALCDEGSNAYECIGEPGANAVLETGVATTHAEDRVLQPHYIEVLKNVLIRWLDDGLAPRLVLVSSGQSCPACHAKAEIVARHLTEGRLFKGQEELFGSVQEILGKNMIVLYGTSYQETARVAGFNDLPYVADLMRFAAEPDGPSMVAYETRDLYDIPKAVTDIFRDAPRKVSILVRGGEVLAVGEDQRTDIDLFSTSEVTAIRTACIKQKQAGLEAPWLLGDPNTRNPDKERKAILYTGSDIGPLMRAELQWSAVNGLVHVTGLPYELPKTCLREIPSMTNDAFLRAMARGYNHDKSRLSVLQSTRTYNKNPFFVWTLKQENMPAVTYNGAACDDALQGYMEKAAFVFRGEALDENSAKADRRSGPTTFYLDPSPT
ncbi:MAG: hypothetical protein PHS57_08310 [Alphaproteobacteria bacterium]|nr:hypothetical protein [Alphaproteobacteria bacterium]